MSQARPAQSDGDCFVLELAPLSDNVRTARLFGATIARHFSCDEELVEDLKLALSEGMNRALRGAAGSTEQLVRLRACKAGDALAFSVVGSGPGGSKPPEQESDLPVAPIEEELIAALFPDASFGESGWSTEFTVPLV